MKNMTTGKNVFIWFNILPYRCEKPVWWRMS